MAFHVVYVAGGELDKVKRVEYVKEIKNFAQLSQPYNKMVLMNIPAIEDVYTLTWTSPNEDMELLSLVVTCSGYGENDYYNLWVNNERWFDTWFPTEVKEGLYIGTAAYVYKLEPESNFVLKFVNMSGTAKKVWLGIRLLREKSTDSVINIEMLDVSQAATPDNGGLFPGSAIKEYEDATVADYTTPEAVPGDITTTPEYATLVQIFVDSGYGIEEAKILAVAHYDSYINSDVFTVPESTSGS